MEYVLIIGKNIDLKKYNFKNKYVIGVDAGAYYALKNNIRLDLAIGDFDSITNSDYMLIEANTKVIKLPCIKDETDTAAALKMCLNASKITILGGIQGKRVEHLLANINLLINNPIIELLDDYSLIRIADKSIKINNNDYKYISFFAIEDSVISLVGFKYSLNAYNFKKYNNLAISNELINEEGSIEIKSGKILMILSKDDNYEKIF